MEVEANIHVTSAIQDCDMHPRTTEFIRSGNAPRLNFTKTVERFDSPKTIRTLNSISATSCCIFIESLFKSVMVYVGRATGSRRDEWCIGSMGSRHMCWLEDRFGFTRSDMATMMVDVRLMYLDNHFQPVNEHEVMRNAFCIAVSEMAIHFDTFDDGTDSIDPICTYLNDRWNEMSSIWCWMTEFIQGRFDRVTKAYLHPSYRCTYHSTGHVPTVLHCSPDLITVSNVHTIYDIKVCRHDDCLQYVRQLDVYAQGYVQHMKPPNLVRMIILNLYLGEQIEFHVF